MSEIVSRSDEGSAVKTIERCTSIGVQHARLDGGDLGINQHAYSVLFESILGIRTESAIERTENMTAAFSQVGFGAIR